MKYLDFHENKKQGTEDFPIAFYHIEPTDARYEMPYHWHQQIEIIRVLEGTFKLMLNGCNHELKAGDVVYIQDGISHGGVPEECIYECVVYDIKILQKSEYRTGDFIRRLARHQYYIPADSLDGRSRKFDYTDLLFTALSDSREGYEMETMAALYLMYSDIYRREAYANNDVNIKASYAHSAKFKKALDFIETHYAENISLEDMAKSAGMSSKYFCRYFKKMSGKTPTGYLNYYRIERACQQLAEGSVSVTDAALGNGFNDISYFIKTFKKQKGVTPRQYKTERFDS